MTTSHWLVGFFVSFSHTSSAADANDDILLMLIPEGDFDDATLNIVNELFVMVVFVLHIPKREDVAALEKAGVDVRTSALESLSLGLQTVQKSGSQSMQSILDVGSAGHALLWIGAHNP